MLQIYNNVRHAFYACLLLSLFGPCCLSASIVAAQDGSRATMTILGLIIGSMTSFILLLYIVIFTVKQFSVQSEPMIHPLPQEYND